VIDVLRGSSAERIMRFGHNRLSTWGIGKERGKEEWNYIARGIVRNGFARQATEEFNAVKITPAGYDLLFRGAKLLLPAAPTRASRARSSSGDDALQPHPDLFQELRVLRKQLADDRGVPPYVIFPDTTLRQMAAQLPLDEARLLTITGVGQRKAQEFGARFLGVIADYVERTGSKPSMTLPPAPVRPSVRRKRLGDTARQSLELFEQGLRIADIARERGLSDITIEGHLEDAIRSGAEIDLDRLVPPERRRVIDAAIDEVGDELLKPIRDRLGDDFSYAEIRFTRAARSN
jgi:ATP-dependent DNA helicase RecQ